MNHRHEGVNIHRLATNPLEQKFAEEWREQNQRMNNLSYILTGQHDWQYISDRDIQVAASVIQWLGSVVGQEFIAEVQPDKRKDG